MMSKENSGRASPVGQEAGDASSATVVKDDKGTEEDTEERDKMEKEAMVNGDVTNNNNDDDDGEESGEQEEITDQEIDGGTYMYVYIRIHTWKLKTDRPSHLLSLKWVS